MIKTCYIKRIDKTSLPVASTGSTKNTLEFLGNSSGNLKKMYQSCYCKHFSNYTMLQRSSYLLRYTDGRSVFSSLLTPGKENKQGDIISYLIKVFIF